MAPMVIGGVKHLEETGLEGAEEPLHRAGSSRWNRYSPLKPWKKPIRQTIEPIAANCGVAEGSLRCSGASSRPPCRTGPRVRHPRGRGNSATRVDEAPANRHEARLTGLRSTNKPPHAGRAAAARRGCRYAADRARALWQTSPAAVECRRCNQHAQVPSRSSNRWAWPPRFRRSCRQPDQD